MFAAMPQPEAPLACPTEPGRVFPVPAHLESRLAPAQWCVYEWTEYWGRFPGADRLRIGSTWLEPIVDDLFILSFANQLGLTSITPYQGERAIGPALHVEVLARKLASPEQSVSFLDALLTDLFARHAALPFVLTAPTERQVRDAFRPPNDLFAFHFFRHHDQQLIRALQAILGSPHRVLADEAALVRVHQVRRIEREAMVRMIQTAPAPHARTHDMHLSTLERLKPERVLQRIPVETMDTPENRFLLAISRMMLSSIERIERARWFREPTVAAVEQDRIRGVKAQLRLLTTDARFAGLEGAAQVPAQSRVLQRRDGYREMALLWQIFQRARQPVFENLQSAIDLGNIADLYEYWVLFELIARIQALSGITPRLSEHASEFGQPGCGLRAMFPGVGTLHYNRSFRGSSGITLRPDYVWERPNGDFIVLDAKFRMSSPQELVAHGSDDGPPAQRYTDSDIQKMHTYRDAIDRVRAAIVLYPGTERMFRTTTGQSRTITLNDIFTGDLDGIGAFPMTPL